MNAVCCTDVKQNLEGVGLMTTENSISVLDKGMQVLLEVRECFEHMHFNTLILLTMDSVSCVHAVPFIFCSTGEFYSVRSYCEMCCAR